MTSQISKEEVQRLQLEYVVKEGSEWFDDLAAKLESTINEVNRYRDGYENAKDSQDKINQILWMINQLSQATFRIDEGARICSEIMKYSSK